MNRHVRRLAWLGPATLAAALLGPAAPAAANPPGDSTAVSWGSATLINNVAPFTDAGTDARGEHPGTFGSQFPRMTRLANGNLLVVYTIYANNGYTHDPNGGNQLQIARSTDSGRNWTVLSTLSDPGRDLDNGQLLQLSNGDVLLAYRSVRWQESYRIEVSRSTNNGAGWTWLSAVDANEGSPGSLGNPDRGVYEPYLQQLPDGSVAIMYANEKHVTESPSYAQVISERISTNNGSSWGGESYSVSDAGNSAARPGMPVWTRMADGRWIVVFEVCGTDNCNGHYKISNDGVSWPSGLGTTLPFQVSAPFILALSDGRLVATSNTHEITISRDYGASWYQDDTHPWASLADADNLWPALIQTGIDEIAAVTSAGRPPLHSTGGHNIQVKFGSFAGYAPPAISSGSRYTITAQHSGQNVDVRAGSGDDGAVVQQYPPNGLPPQSWQLSAQPDGSYYVINQQSGKYLEVKNNLGTDGAEVDQWSYTGCACQRWFFDYVGAGLYRIRNAGSGLNLDVTGGSLASSTPLEQYHDNSARPQRWRLTPAP
ncbi:RICIN domain-containing protein [Dactylosporangium sp. CA-233914]|uniref:RICIN domain-containing protein n=1 Tax=Dactylosporangium sp. CA-233914 TaxID=3239934 RepID=UPI003D906D44